MEKIGILFCAKELHECLKHLRPVIGGLENKLPWNPEPLLMVQPQSEPAPSFDAYCLLEYRLPPTHPLAFFLLPQLVHLLVCRLLRTTEFWAIDQQRVPFQSFPSPLLEENS